MSELAKTHITITDDSAYANGIDTLIPLYVFATEQDKVIDETTGEIATGTTKALANEVTIVTSKKDVVDKFGAPKFYESNGTVLQGDERNEYGLFALYDAMGSTSLAYALRADIDLKGLTPAEEEPTANVKNNTLWLDMTNTNLGLFICNSATARATSAWTKVENIELVTEVPTSAKGENGDYVLYVHDADQKIYTKKLGEWYILGATENTGKVYHQSSINYPTSPAVNDYWVKTTSTNNGANYVLKRWSSTSERWMDVDFPLATSLVDVEVLYGSNLVDGVLANICDDNEATTKTYKYAKSDTGMTITGTGTTVVAGTIKLSTAIDGVLKTISITTTSTDTIDTIVTKINAGNVSTVSAKKLADGKLQIMVSRGVLNISEDTENTPVLTGLGITAGDHQPESASWTEYKDIKVSMTEPRETAEEGTLWFNDDVKVDVMVNNGTTWQGYNSKYSTASIYVTSEEPTDTVNDSLWINPSATNYPEIKRYISGEWVLIDNTDQTTPDGIVFADARYYAITESEGTYTYTDPTYSVNSSTGKITSNLLTNNSVDPDAPNPQTYPAGILLFNTRFSTNNVKEFKLKPFEGLYDSDTKVYTVGGYSGKVDTTKMTRWTTASGNAADGSGLFGRDAQRKMVTNALAEAIVSNEDIRTFDYDFFFATCPGYPELDDELINLNTDKKEMFEIISDTPKTLAPSGKAIQEWGTNANNAVSHGTAGRVLKNEYVTRQYPPMGLTSNADGAEIAVPSSVAKMKNLLVLPRGQIAAGTQNGQVTNLASVGYITDEQEYASVVINDGLGEICTAQSINPIMPRRNTGLLFWGEATENSITSSLSDEHAIITLLRLKRQLESACLPFFFRINNESLRSEFNNVLKGVLDTFVGTGEIYDYALEVESQNTSETINRKELWAAIAIEIAKGVEQIYIPIRVVATGALSE